LAILSRERIINTIKSETANTRATGPFVSEPEIPRRLQVESKLRQSLQAAEERYHFALAHTKKVQAELDSMSQPEGDLALKEALVSQNQAVSEYAQALDAFTRFVLYGEYPSNDTGH
jgi:hypothetical protein